MICVRTLQGHMHEQSDLNICAKLVCPTQKHIQLECMFLFAMPYFLFWCCAMRWPEISDPVYVNNDIDKSLHHCPRECIIGYQSELRTHAINKLHIPGHYMSKQPSTPSHTYTCRHTVSPSDWGALSVRGHLPN